MDRGIFVIVLACLHAHSGIAYREYGKQMGC